MSHQRILTTHVGSLPRSKAVTDVVFALENNQAVDNSEAERIIRRAVRQVLIRQSEAGIDVASDGEMSKISYATYIKDRITGFDGDSPRQPPKDLEDFHRADILRDHRWTRLSDRGEGSVYDARRRWDLTAGRLLHYN